MTLQEAIQILPLIQALNFTLLLLTIKNVNTKANKILGFYMLIISFQYLFSAFDILKFYDLTILTYYFIMPLMLSGVPFLLFYIKFLTLEDYKFNIKELFHFIPALIILLINIYSLSNISYSDTIQIIKGTYKNNNQYLLAFLNAYNLSNLIYNIQILFYSCFLIYLLIKHKANIKHKFSFKENITLNWLTVFVFVFIVFSIFELIVYYFNILKLSEIYYSLTIVSFLSFLGYFGIRQSDIYVKKNISQPNSQEQIMKNLSEEIFSTPKRLQNTILAQKQGFTLSENQINKVIRDTIDLMETKKPYLNCKLTLYDLSSQLNINKNYLSQIINEHFKNNFFNFINEYRIKEAQKLISGPEYDKLSMEGIAKLVGFNSKSAFNPAFKKFIGMTPSEYRTKTKM